MLGRTRNVSSGVCRNSHRGAIFGVLGPGGTGTFTYGSPALNLEVLPIGQTGAVRALYPAKCQRIRRWLLHHAVVLPCASRLPVPYLRQQYYMPSDAE